MSSPMIFSVDKAFNQLKNKGRVASFRTKEKDLGEVWIRRSRTGSKEFDAEVKIVEKVENPEELENLSGISGFDSLQEWCDKIREVYGDFPEGYVHIVDKKSD